MVRHTYPFLIILLYLVPNLYGFINLKIEINETSLKTFLKDLSGQYQTVLNRTASTSSPKSLRPNSSIISHISDLSSSTKSHVSSSTKSDLSSSKQTTFTNKSRTLPKIIDNIASKITTSSAIYTPKVSSKSTNSTTTTTTSEAEYQNENEYQNDLYTDDNETSDIPRQYSHVSEYAQVN